MSDGITPLTPSQQAVQATEAGKEGYVLRNLIALDMEANSILGGKPDETISSRLARDAEEGHAVGIIGSKILDVFQPDHGAKAQAGDVGRAKAVETLEEDSPGLAK